MATAALMIWLRRTNPVTVASVAEVARMILVGRRVTTAEVSEPAVIVFAACFTTVALVFD